MDTMISMRLSALAVLVTLAAPDQPLQHFQQNVAAYLVVRHRVAALLTPEVVTSSVETLQRTENRLAAGIRAARRHARRGDVFTADVAQRFRGLISLTLRNDGIDPAEVVAEV